MTGYTGQTNDGAKQDIAFYPQSMILAPFPSSDPHTSQYIKRASSYSMMISNWPEIGIPYGVYPRLILAWVTTEAKKTKDKTIYLGRSRREFLQNLGLVSTSGKANKIVQDQMLRLFTSRFTFQSSETKSKTRFRVFEDLTPVRRLVYQENDEKWEPEITLNQEFLDNVLSFPIPVKREVIYALRKSPLAIDLYVWLTFSMFMIRNKKKDVYIKWKVMREQFGNEYSDSRSGIKSFKQQCIKAFYKISKLYPEARVDYRGTPDSLVLIPSPTSIKSL